MTFGNSSRVLGATLAGLAWCLPAAAQWPGVDNDWDLVTATGGFGLSYLEANEFVFVGDYTLSHLIWQSAAVPTASGAVTVPLEEGWRVSLNGAAGISGFGHMEDYDWISPHATGNGPDDWSHQSIHPDTRLDHYLSAGLRLGQDFVQEPAVRAGLHAELHYTDVQWTAHGGSYTYSDGGFRNDTGTFANEPVITYRQSLPMIMAGADVETREGVWRTAATLQGGLTFLAQAVDDHWLRDLRFTDTFSAAPVLAADARVGYSFSGAAEVYAEASARKVFELTGDTENTDTTDGSVTYSPGAAGGDFLSVSLTAGLRGRF